MHEVKFYRNHEGEYRAVCRCGWSSEDKTLTDLQGRAATHDLDAPRQVDIMNGFVSGLA